MKKIIIVGFCVLMIGKLSAQFVPNSSQAFQLMQSYNPAFTGFEGFTSLKLGYRSQWASFPGAPRFINVVGSGRIQNPTDVIHNALRVGTPVKETEIPKSKRLIHGLGGTFLNVTNGAQGIIENTAGGVTYALHYPLESGMYLAMGLAANFESIRVNWNKLELEDDPLVTNGGGPFTNFNIRTGVLLYTSKFYIHASYYELYSKTNTGTLQDVGYHYKGSAGLGLRFDASSSIEFRPSILMLMDQENNIDLDFSVKMYYNDRAWGGISYRDNGFLAIILGFELNSLVGFSYSYEMSTGGLQGFNNGSNEFILGLKLANLRKLNPSIW